MGTQHRHRGRSEGIGGRKHPWCQWRGWVGSPEQEIMTNGVCLQLLRWFLMLQGLVGLLGPGAQALEVEVRGQSGAWVQPRALPPTDGALPKATQSPPSSADFLGQPGTYRVNAF